MYIHISPHRTCASQIQRCAEHLEAASADPSRVVDAIRSAHVALMAAMVEALSGTAGVGAFADKLAGDHLEFLNGARPDMSGDRTLDYGQLLERVQEPSRLDFSPPLRLSEDDAKALAELNRVRGLIDHPKPTHWSMEIEHILRVLAPVPDVLEFCTAAVGHHYLDDDGASVEDGLARIRAGLAAAHRLARVQTENEMAT